MKDRKRCAILFRYRDCDAFAKYLRRQSAEGWHFKEFKLGMVFERGEPEDVVYAVEVFPKGTEMDVKPEPETEEYAAYCEAAGWQLVDSIRRFCVFRRTGEDAGPITEPEERFQNIRKAEWREWLGTAVSPLLLAVLWGWAFFTIGFRQYIFNDTLLFFLLVVMGGALQRVWNAASLLLWSRRVKRRLSGGETVVYGRGRRRGGSWLGFILVMAAGLLIAHKDGYTQALIPALIAAAGILCCGIFIAIKRPSRAGNEGIQYLAAFGIFLAAMVAIVVILISDPDRGPHFTKGPDASGFPLIQADYSEGEWELTYTDSGASDGVLGSMRYFYVTAGRNEDGNGEDSTELLSYTIYQSRHAWILDRLWRQEEKSFAGGDDCAGQWRAARALCCEEDGAARYLLRYEDRLITLWMEPPADDGKIDVIREKLTAYEPEG